MVCELVSWNDVIGFVHFILAQFVYSTWNSTQEILVACPIASLVPHYCVYLVKHCRTCFGALQQTISKEFREILAIQDNKCHLPRYVLLRRHVTVYVAQGAVQILIVRSLKTELS